MSDHVESEPEHAPLAGVQVVEFARVVSGPFACLQLAQLGATVTKVEPPGGDLTRHVGPRVGDVSAYFHSLNRGKRSIVVDLRDGDGRAVAADLVARADVVVENWRPGVADRVGLGDDDVARINPRAVVARISGFGRSGPYAEGRVYDKVVQGVAGLTSIQHGADRPELIETTIADKVAALAAVQGILAALLRRERTGRGGRVEINLLDPLLAFAWPDRMIDRTFPDVAADPLPAAPYALLRCADGSWLSITVVSDREWAGLAAVLEMPDWVRTFPTGDDRQAHWGAIRDRAQQVAGTRPRRALLADLARAGVPSGPVNTLDEVLDDPQVVANDTVRETTRPGIGRVRDAGPLAGLDGGEAGLGPAPALGQHTDEVLAQLGREPDAIQRLRRHDAVA